VDNGGLRYGAMESALRPPLPTATRHVVLNRQSSFGSRENQTALTDPVQANIIASDPRKQTSGGRHQIGTLAGFKSECLAGFVGIRRRLRIELIQATTPQAKGRVERANQTLQDRLIKEMRLRAISDIPCAQVFAEEFIELWNARFARPPLDAAEAHRPWTIGSQALDEALARREERVLAKALTFSVGGKIYCVRTNGPGTALRGARVTLLHFQDGAMRVDYKSRSLPYSHFKTNLGPDPTEDEKTIDARMAQIVAASLEKAAAEPVSTQGRG
jgi:hypothetical protein